MNLLIKGFKSYRHAQAFIDWYCGQGEQDFYQYQEGDEIDSQDCDAAKTYPLKVDDHGNLLMELEQY